MFDTDDVDEAKRMLPIYKRAVDLLETVIGKKTEQAEQEPVAWMDLHKELGKLRWMGGDEGWDNAINAVRDRLIELSAPVRTKDLTDDEIEAIFEYWYSQPETEVWSTVDLARAVIAADRKKNK